MIARKTVISLILALSLPILLAGCASHGKGFEPSETPMSQQPHEAVEVAAAFEEPDDGGFHETEDSAAIAEERGNRVLNEAERAYYRLEVVTSENIRRVTHSEGLEGLSMCFVFVSGWADSGKAGRINRIIYTEMTTWIYDILSRESQGDSLLDWFPNQLTVLCNTPRYLSVNSVIEDPGSHHYISDFITIDIIDERRVFLDDLVDVSDEFLHHLRTQDIVWGWGFEAPSSEILWEILGEMPL